MKPSKFSSFYKNNKYKFWMIFILVLGTILFVPLFSIGFWFFFTSFVAIGATVGMIISGLVGEMFLIGGLCIASMCKSAAEE